MGQFSSPSQTLWWTVCEQLYLKDSYGIPPSVSKAAETTTLQGNDQIEDNTLLLASVHTHTHTHTHTHMHPRQRCHRACVELNFLPLCSPGQPCGGEHAAN